MKSREHLYGTVVRMTAQRAAEARKDADALAGDAWTKRMLAFNGPAQPSPALGDALNAGYRYLEVRARHYPPAEDDAECRETIALGRSWASRWWPTLIPRGNV